MRAHSSDESAREPNQTRQHFSCDIRLALAHTTSRVEAESQKQLYYIISGLFKDNDRNKNQKKCRIDDIRKHLESRIDEQFTRISHRFLFQQSPSQLIEFVRLARSFRNISIFPPNCRESQTAYERLTNSEWRRHLGLLVLMVSHAHMSYTS